MIIFQTTDNYKLDLTQYGVNFNEESPNFKEDIQKNYSLPFNISLDDETALKLGLPNLDNISGYKIKIEGFLILDYKFYKAYLVINEIVKKKAEITLFYGEDILAVFDKKLSQLPFPIINAGIALVDYAQMQLSKSYPETSHNFPKVYRPEIKEKSKYELFQLFVNNYADPGYFLSNAMSYPVDNPSVPNNKNVMAPMTYLLEVLRVGFKSEGLELRGEFPNDEFCKKIVLIPKQFFQEYSDPDQRDMFSFDFFNNQETVDGKTVNIYEKIHVPTAKGTYTLKYSVNFPKGIADFFQLQITYGETVLFNASATNDALILNDTLSINLTEDGPYENIKTTLRISQQVNSIESLQRFIFDFKDGNLNVFPQEYSLADFMPNMTFKTYFNIIKKWANLDVVYLKNAVYLNYLDNSIKKLNFDDDSEFEVLDYKRTLNKNNLFKLMYPNGDEVLVNKTGQIYNENDYLSGETETVEFDILPLKIADNENLITGEYPEDDNEIMIGLYNGLLNNQPVLVDKFANRNLSLQDIYQNWHKIWLSFRTNSEIYKDTFFCHISKPFDFKKGIKKYNKLHLIKTLNKKRVNEEYWKVDMETETF